MIGQIFRHVALTAEAFLMIACGSGGGSSGGPTLDAGTVIEDRSDDVVGPATADRPDAVGDDAATDTGGGPDTGGGFQAAQPTAAIALNGSGAASGLPLTARIEAYVEDEHTLRLRIDNTCPDTSSSIDGAPVLIAIGFNVAGDLSDGCLTAEGVNGAQPALVPTTAETALCSGLSADVERFVIELGAEGAAPGVGRAQTREVVLRVPDDCAGDFAFSEDALLQAPRSAASERLVQWAARVDRVGVDGLDGGCVVGDGAPAPVRVPIDTIWTNFVATCAERDPQPSSVSAGDTRAGSLDVRFDDGVDALGQPVAPDEPLAIATIRNGKGDILEQWHLNDPWPPPTLGEDGCDTTTPYSACYVYPTTGEDGAADPLWADLPSTVADSNVGFDDDGGRVTIEGRPGFEPAGDGTERRAVRIRWAHPDGIDHARLNLRAQTDFNLDGSSDDDAFVTLFRASWFGSGEDLIAPPVTIIEQSVNSIVVEVDVDAARSWVRQTYGAE